MKALRLVCGTINGNPRQQYRVEPVGGGYYRIMNRVSSYVLDIAACSNVPGADVTHWRWKGLDCQLWKFEPISANRRSCGERSNLHSVKTYPNPARTELNIVMDAGGDGKPAGLQDNKEFSYGLYNTNGSLVAKGVSTKGSNATKSGHQESAQGHLFFTCEQGN